MTEIRNGKRVIITPVSEEDIKSLRIGDTIYIEGYIATGRDSVHERVTGEGRDMPVDIRDGVLIHAGPIVRDRGDGHYEMLACGPTTSMRMESFEYDFIKRTGVRILIGKPKGLRTSSYCLMRKYVRDSIIKYPAQYSHMQGLVLRTVSPAKIASVPIQHFDRAYGTSNYSLKKLISLWSNIAGFSIVPLRISRTFGEILSAIGILGMVWLIVRKVVKSTQILGWTSTMMAIIFFSGVILITLGIVGEYIGRMFLTISNYPQFVVRGVYRNGKEQPADRIEPDGQ